MKLKVNYFIFLKPDAWEPVFEEQIGGLYKLQLYNDAIQIIVSAVSDFPEEYHKVLNLIYTKYPKIVFGNFELGHHAGEYYGFKTLYDIAEDNEDTIILHYHSKGICSGYDETRSLMFKHTIENYKTYVNAFENNKNIQLAGAIINPEGFTYFTFFWVRSSYLKRYCIVPKFTLDRFYWEIYTATDYSKQQKESGNVIIYSPYNFIANTADEAIMYHEELKSM